MALKGVKNKNSGKWKKIVSFLFLLLLLLVLLRSVNNVYEKKKAADEALVRMKKEISNLEAREKSLKQDLARLNTKEGLEFEMKKNLNVAAAGESVAVIVPYTEPTSTSVIKVSAWQKIKNFFTDLFK
jgi:cell division protein FtsB